jgi:cysteinylglycine-S-conjugate dipeptidase
LSIPSRPIVSDNATVARPERLADAADEGLVISEGSEEQSTGGLAALIRDQPGLLRADVVLVCDAGNVRAGQPTLITSLRGVVHATVTARAARQG